MIIINFKIYQETFGDKAINLAKIVKEVSEKYKIRIIITASALDAYRIQKETGAEVWLQNVDEYRDGKHTGWISSDQALELGIKGSLLNHFEHQIPKGTVQKIIKNKSPDFKIICCAKHVGQIDSWIAKAKPDFILYEPPELIGSSTSSVASLPDCIKKAVNSSGDVPLIVGAGVKSRQDVVTSLKYGAKSVGLASAFVLSQNPRELLEEIAAGFDGIIQK
ncbi:triose-phosphate isomerase [Candidatus Shapirobacteria bacterium]|nr:triose-phosphate isomerase [Candidatus Shapirobacteria bacterium]